MLRAHRNEQGHGDHAEHILLQKARSSGIVVERAILVVTLEPCTQRGLGKVACARRVVASGIPEVWFGALDPNPEMPIRGEEILRFAGVRVERFPDHLIREVRTQSRPFIDQFAPVYRASQVTTLPSAQAQPVG